MKNSKFNRLTALAISLNKIFDVVRPAFDEGTIDPDIPIASDESDLDGHDNICSVGELLPYYLSNYVRLQAETECIYAMGDFKEEIQTVLIQKELKVEELRELGQLLVTQLSREGDNSRITAYLEDWSQDQMGASPFIMTNPYNGKQDTVYSLYHAIINRDNAIGLKNFIQNKLQPRNDWHPEIDANTDWIPEKIGEISLEEKDTLFSLIGAYLRVTFWPYRDLVDEESEFSVIFEQPYINQLKTKFDMTMNHEMRESIIREARERGFLDSNNPDTRQLLDRLNDLISGIGYDNLRQDLEDHGHISNRYPDVTVIPSDASTSAPHCTSTLIALAHRANGPHGFAGVVDQMVEHLKRCPQTWQVIFITDHWGYDKITKVHSKLNDFKKSHGTKFLFLLVDPFNKHRWNIVTGLK
jgi:hypothetical protein